MRAPGQSVTWLRALGRRPDILVGLAKFALVSVVFWLTPLHLRSVDRVIFNHLADSFGAGALSAALTVFAFLLLRRAPLAPRRTLGWGWGFIVAVSAVGLLFAYAHPSRTSTSWMLQALLLSTLAWTVLLALLLPGLGLVRWRDLVGAGGELVRDWAGIFLHLLAGGYLLAIVRVYSPIVHDPLLLKMDASLGWRGVEAIAGWTSTHPAALFLTEYTYPLLGFFVASVAALLHLAGARAALRRYLLAVILVPLFGITCYWVLPAVGPCYAFPSLLAPGAAADSAAQTLRASVLAGADTMPFRSSVARNVMPSLHTAFTLVALIGAWRHGRRWFLLSLPLGFTQVATTLTYGVHYVVDLIAAVPLAVLCWALAEAGARRFPPGDAAPLAALGGNSERRDRRVLTLAAALVASVAALVAWGAAAPVSPLLAWPLSVGIVAAPAVAAVRLFSTTRSTAPVTAPPGPAPVPPVAPARLLAGAVFCTGATALVLQQVAEKYLSTLLGASRPAATLVLAVFFAGLALGAALCPKRAAGAGRRLAALELFVAAWCVLLAFGFFAVDRALGEWLAAHDHSAWTLTAARGAVATLWLLPPTLAMGAQLPTLAAVLTALPGLSVAALPRFYALNLAGACAFAFGAPVVLFNLVGANGALVFTAVLGGLVGLALWSGLPHVRTGRAAAPLPPPAPPPFASPAAPRLPALGLAFASGFAFFALEVVWFHLIGAVCGASTYSFSLLLGVVLLALALAGRSAARGDLPPLTHTAAALALALVLGSAAWPWAGRTLAALAGGLGLESFWAGELLKTAVVSAVVLPSALLLGRIFPRLLRDAGDGTAVGRLSVANILGSVGGAIAAGLVFIPRLGAERTLWLAAVLPAIAALTRFRTLPGLHRGLALAALALAAALPPWDRLALTRGHGVYLNSGLPADSELAWFREDFTAGFVTVATRTDGRGRTVRTLLQNGKFDADDAGEVPAQVSFGFLAALHAPATERALVIGAGSGQTAAVVAQLGFRHLDIAELSPAHLAAARAEFAHLHHGVFDRPGVTVQVEDGRQLLLRSRTPYDVIQIELTSLWFAGATNLYSREFYALARSRLVAGGALVQWVQLHHLAPREIATILATARAEFLHVALWSAGHQACLVATTSPPRPNVTVWERWLRDPALAAARTATGLDSAEKLAATELLTAPQLDALLRRHAGAYGLNTDRNRWIEFQSPKYYLSRFDHRAANLRWLTSRPPAAP